MIRNRVTAILNGVLRSAGEAATKVGIQRGFGGKLNRIKRYLPRTEQDKELEEKSKAPVMVGQHPKGLDDTNPQILTTEQTYYLTKHHTVDARFYSAPLTELAGKPKQEIPKLTRFIRVSVIGLPNAGKSTLVNKVVGTQVSPVSKLSYTTWENTVGVKSDLNTGVQMELIDTPGVVDRYDQTKVQVTEAWKAAEDSDLILFVVDGARRIENATIQALKLLKTKVANSSYQEQKLARKMKFEDLGNVSRPPTLNSRQSLVLVINKVDICQSKRKIIELKDELEDIVHFDKIFIVSAETGFGLDGLQDYISQQAEDGEWEHSPDIKTEQSEAHIVEELIRESLFNRFYYDVPFHVNINLTQMAVRSDGLMSVNAHLRVLNKNVVPILIGKHGLNLKWMVEDVESKLSQRYRIRSKVTFSVSISKHSAKIALANAADNVDDPETNLKEEQKELELQHQKRIEKHDQLKTLQEHTKGMSEIEELKRMLSSGKPAPYPERQPEPDDKITTDQTVGRPTGRGRSISKSKFKLKTVSNSLARD